jgi:hypothetical protein
MSGASLLFLIIFIFIIINPVSLLSFVASMPAAKPDEP